MLKQSLTPSSLVKKAAIVTVCGTAMLIPVAVALAWNTSQSASASCVNSGADIHVSFTNTESDTSKAMHVVAVDSQTGNATDLGTIAAKQTQSADIITGKQSITDGIVTFTLTWANGQSGTDTRTAAYSAVTCQASSPTPTQQPSETPTETPTQTITPTPTECPDTVTPTESPTPTPTSTPSVTPTETQAVTPTPTPNTPTINVVVQSVNVTPTPIPPQVMPAPKAQTLPKTGGETEVLFGLLSLLPVGFTLRKLSK